MTDEELLTLARQAPPEAWAALEQRRTLTELHALVGVPAFDWAGWGGLGDATSPETVAAGSAADAVRLVTAITRADRFMGGTIAICERNGTVRAIGERLLEWHRDAD